MNIVNNVVGGVEKNLKDFGFIANNNANQNDQ